MIFLRKYETDLIFPNLFQWEEVNLRDLPSVTPPYCALSYAIRVGWWILDLWGYWIFFSRKINSTFTNVCLSVHQQNTNLWKEFKSNNVVEVWPSLMFSWGHTSSTLSLRSLHQRSINQPLCNMNDNFVTKHIVAIELSYAVWFLMSYPYYRIFDCHRH